MLRIGICDDSAKARLSLHAMLERLLEKRAVESQIYEFSSGEGLLGWIEKHTGEVDLVFLDIEMGGMNGMEAAKALRAQSDTLQLVFVTGYTDFVFDGYSVGALGYVMKPPQAGQIDDVLTRALRRSSTKRTRSFMPQYGRFVPHPEKVHPLFLLRPAAGHLRDRYTRDYLLRPAGRRGGVGRRVVCAHPPALSGARGCGRPRGGRHGRDRGGQAAGQPVVPGHRARGHRARHAGMRGRTG